MNISEEISFDKEGEIEPEGWRKYFKGYLKEFYLSLVIILVAILSFGLGKLFGGGQSEPIKIEYDQSLVQSGSTVIGPVSASTSSSTVYASSGGTRYYYENCTGLSRIAAKNKISFSSPALAEAAGYSLAANCVAK